MNGRRIGYGWTLALLALLGHVAGADCCLIRGAVRETLERATALAATPEAHACCASKDSGSASGRAGATRDQAPAPECCGVNCAPIAKLQAALVLAAPVTDAVVGAEVVGVPAAPAPVSAEFAVCLTGSPSEPSPRAARGRAPPIA